MRMIFSIAVAFAVAATGIPAAAQQVPDPNADTSVANPSFAKGAGPVLSFDSAHSENQTLAGRYAALGAVLTNDGYVVRNFNLPITAANLANAGVLVIAEPLNPNDPKGKPQAYSTSAFTAAEIVTINAWVKSGGALLMIADHPPYAGSLRALGESFGFEIAMFAAQNSAGQWAEFFSFANGLLNDGPLTHGLPQIETFYGTSFTAPTGATPLMHFDASWQMLVLDSNPRPMTANDLRGATLPYGKGRVVLLAEGGAWSAQLLGKDRKQVGFNNPNAKGNKQFIRNVMFWLGTGKNPS